MNSILSSTLPILGTQPVVHEPYVPSVIWVIPFVAMLLSIAVLPLVAAHWWHSNLNRFKVALVCGLPVFALFAFQGDWHRIHHTVHEYASFLILLASLYTVSGGIVLRGDLKASPFVNTMFLLIGSLLASFMGTTGAAMLLIRPLLKTNSQRKHKVHTAVFFVFTVCNIGGCLTPLGDPPLFLGYLRGVPFAWTFGLVAPWAFALFVLLCFYFAVDTFFYRKEEGLDLRDDAEHVEPLRLQGIFNFVWLAGVILSVAFLTTDNLKSWLGEDVPGLAFGRDLALVLIGVLAYLTTNKKFREANEFTWHPILEVAALFFGIFLSMMAAIALLETNGQEMPLDSPHHYFWLTGILSAFLDNAPTYVVFFEAAASKAQAEGITENLVAGVPEINLIAISLGAVFMGAVTYIGNAPNFMVKSIAEERKVAMPSFFGYMVYSVCILLPVFFAATLIFL